VNADNLRAEIERLQRAAKGEYDSTIRRACQHRIADLERELEKKTEKEKTHMTSSE
jgi:hypothetical protein